MAEVWQRIRAVGERMWRSAIEETSRQGAKPLAPPSFYPLRGFDNPADIDLAALMAANLRRREREELRIPTTTETLKGVGIGQEGFISTNRLLWLAGTTLTWAESGAAAYKVAEMWNGDATSGPVRIAGTLVASFVTTSIVNELFLRRLVRT